MELAIVGFATSLMLAILGFLFFAGFSVFKFMMFYFDKFLVFIMTWNHVHYKFATKVAEGKAIYFWDILFSVAAVVIYSILFRMLHKKYVILGKIINFIISFVGSLFVCWLLAMIFFPRATTYLLPLLKNPTANELLNFGLLLIPTIIVFIKRESNLLSLEEYDLFDYRNIYRVVRDSSRRRAYSPRAKAGATQYAPSAMTMNSSYYQPPQRVSETVVEDVIRPSDSIMDDGAV
ncbi:MAG: hypothetical protein Q4D65_02625 [Peptostreptococcaceae bacterium]|nr:hypothetical protein [Peptostreptococcaceae bacterium]